MAEVKSTTAAADASKEASVVAKVVNQKALVQVKNVSTRTINTSRGSIKAGKEGKATVAEARQLNKFLKKVTGK